MTESRHSLGMKTRRRVLGDAYVDGAEAAKTDFDADFQRYIAENAWCDVWSREGLTPRERSLITVAILAARGHHDELALHLRATRNTGASAAEVREALLHVAVYAGVPAANSAFKIAKRNFAELAEAGDEGDQP